MPNPDAMPLAVPTPGLPSRLEHLRAHTRALHARLDSVPALARLTAPDLALDEYAAILRSLEAFHRVVEPAIARGLGRDTAAALLDGRRPRALREDLAWLGVRPAPTAPEFPPFAHPDAALGALYVVEGGNLGGRVIARRISDSLGLAPDRGGSFYGGLSAEAARRQWLALCAILEDPGRRVALQPLAQGACRAFAALEEWMRHALSPA